MVGDVDDRRFEILGHGVAARLVGPGHKFAVEGYRLVRHAGQAFGYAIDHAHPGSGIGHPFAHGLGVDPACKAIEIERGRER